MEIDDFYKARKKLGKTQKELAELLGLAMKTVQCYEQGSRKIPAYIEREVWYLLSNQRGIPITTEMCWDVVECGVKEQCPAWEFQTGHMCWFICGTMCECTKGCTLEEKSGKCRSCMIIQDLLA
ncbi:MAG: helix-turn-helix domain-containing protein [Proteobacteria bacterium]|nr:helix-turn-helix domain-containing protein [Pseudomonadota bacterium]